MSRIFMFESGCRATRRAVNRRFRGWCEVLRKAASRRGRACSARGEGFEHNWCEPLAAHLSETSYVTRCWDGHPECSAVPGGWEAEASRKQSADPSHSRLVVKRHRSAPLSGSCRTQSLLSTSHRGKRPSSRGGVWRRVLLTHRPASVCT